MQLHIHSLSQLSMWKTFGIIAGVLVLGFLFLVFWGSGDYNKDADLITAKTKEILAQFKDNKIDEAYQDADEEFKKTARKEDLLQLTKIFPIIAQYVDVKIDGMTHDEKTAEVKGTLSDAEKKESKFILNLSKSSGSWKLYSFDMNDEAKPTATDKDAGKTDTKAKITKVTVGDGFDSDGITIAQEKIPATTSALYISVIVADQTADAIMANVKLVHIATGDSIDDSLPIYKTTSGAQFTTRFKFTKPTNNWPMGKNKVVVTLANGATKEVEYEVK